MISQPIRAVYTGGQFRLLDPVPLAEGQAIYLVILSEADQARTVLEDLLVHFPDPGIEVDEVALAEEIELGFRGQPSLSETIIAERHTGP